MGKQDEIRNALHEHAKRYGPSATMLATVQSVDDAKFTCVLIDDEDLIYEDVRLRPVLDGKESMTIFPKQGTWCLAVRLEDDEDWMAIAFGEIDKWRFKIGTVQYEATAGGHVIKKGNDSLWDGVKLLIEALEQIMVLQGNNPDFVKMAQAKVMIKNILNGT